MDKLGTVVKVINYISPVNENTQCSASQSRWVNSAYKQRVLRAMTLESPEGILVIAAECCQLPRTKCYWNCYVSYNENYVFEAEVDEDTDERMWDKFDKHNAEGDSWVVIRADACTIPDAP